MAHDVVVVRTGVANLASVLAGLRRAGAEPTLADTAQAVTAASHLVVPGVGAFGAGMQALHAMGVADALRQRLADGTRPTLGICMGLQLFCRSSEENPGDAGLGALDATVRRFTGDVRVPQLGWNAVEPAAECRLVAPGYAYFAHSYRLQAAPAGWHGALTQHGGPCVAALERGPMLLCQFHPELSGAYGLALLGRWLELA